MPANAYFTPRAARRMAITVEQMYRIENNGHEMGFQKKFMMENAGAAAARLLTDALGGDAASKRITVFAGLGNNGGDGMVAARHLAGRGALVRVFLLGGPGGIRTEECAWNWSLLGRMPSVEKKAIAGPAELPGAAKFAPDAVIDAILGTGIEGGAVREPHASAMRLFNSARGCAKMSVDVPSGLDPQTGEAAGGCARADFTVTFHRVKVGLLKRPDLTGRLHAEPIGIPPEAEKGVLP